MTSRVRLRRRSATWLAITLLWTTACRLEARATDLVVDSAHSLLTFTVTKWGLVEVQGQVHDFEGTIRWDPTDPASSTTRWTARVDSIRTGEPRRDESLLDPPYFDARRHPVVTFRSVRATPVDASTLSLDGELTMRGVTKAVRATVRYVGERDIPGEGRVRVFETALVVNRRDFGIVGGRVLGPVISDEVRIVVRAAARDAVRAGS